MSPASLKKPRNGPPRCIVIAGPNGAGKTTFAREFLPAYANVIHFVNADLIAAGLSPLRPEMAAIAAGRLFLRELDRLAGAGEILRLKARIYLKLPSAGIGLNRIAARVRQGGHDVPTRDVARRFERSWENFQTIYRPLADSWWVNDNSGDRPQLVDEGP